MPVLRILALILLISIPVRGSETNSLTWKDCVRIIISNNLELKQARQGIVQAEADRLSALDAYLPGFSASAGSVFAKSTGVPYPGPRLSVGIGVQQLIFDGFSSIADIHRGGLMKKAAELNYCIVSANVRQKARNAYADFIKAKKNIALTAEILALRQNQYESVKFQYEAGRENDGAVKSSEADLANARLESEQALRSLGFGRKELVYILGVTNADYDFIEESLPDRPPSDPPDMAALTRTNIKIRYYSILRDAAVEQLRSARGALYPRVSLDAQAGSSGSTLAFGDGRLSLGFNFALPLLDAPNVISRISSGKSGLENSRSTLEDQSRRLRLDLEESWQNYRDAFSLLEIRKKYLDAAVERSTISDSQYSTGLLTFDIWTTIHDNLVNSEKNLLEAESQIMKAEAVWISDRGGTLEDE